MTEVLRFHDYFRSSAAYRCRIAFNLKGVTPDRHFVDLKTGVHHGSDFRAINPAGAVPFIETPDGGLGQALAILEWLDETHPAPPLLPKDPWARAKVRAFAQAIACDIHPVNNLRVLVYLRQTLGHDAAEVNAWYRHWIAEGLASCEAMIPGGGRFAFGDAPGLADICLVPQLYNARRFDCPLDAYPKLVAIDAACRALPAFADAAPEAQPDCDL